MEGALSDVFGHPSQVPQILAGFGIRSALFVRGLTPEQKRQGWVQRWLAPDGQSSVIMYFLPGLGYASLYYWGMDSFDPSTYPTIPTDAGEWSADLALKHLMTAVGNFEAGTMTTRHLWLGNGVDHQEAQPHTPLVIRELNRRQKKVRLVHSTYERLMNAVRDERRRLPVIKGQFRLGLHGTMTSRVYQKQAYASIAGRTEMLAEPLLALVDVFGKGHRAFREMGHRSYTFNPGQNWASFPSYPSGRTEYLWKLLLRNGPHDDICGCSVDATHQDMDNRFKRAREISEYFASDALLVMASRIVEGRQDSKLPVLVAFNPHPFSAKERLTASLFVEGLETVKGLAVRDARGKAVPFVINRAARAERRLWDGNNFTKEGVKGLDLVLSLVPRMKPCSFASFTLSRGASRAAARSLHCPAASVLKLKNALVVENKFNRITVHRDGTFDVFDKVLRRRFAGLGLVEDVEDVGDTYTFRRFKKPGRAVTSRGAAGILRVVSHDAISTAVEVRLTLHVPQGLAADRSARSRRTVGCPVRVLLEIPHYRGGGRIRVSVENRAKDHELFLTFPTGIAAESFEYDSKFDYGSYDVGEPVARIDSLAVVRAKGKGRGARPSIGVVGECPTLLQSRRGRRGDAVLSWSLFRSVGMVNRDIPVEFWGAAEAQCLRTIKRTYEWITGGYDDVRRACLEMRRTINAPPALLPVTPWRKLRYIDREFTALPVPGTSMLDIKGRDVHLSAWKKSDDGTGWIVRVYSLAARAQICRISAAVPTSAALLCDLAEKPVTRLAGSPQRGYRLPIASREIRTVLLKLEAKALAAAAELKP